MAAYRVVHAAAKNLKSPSLFVNFETNSNIQRIACYSALSSSLPGVEVPDLSMTTNRRKNKILADMKRLQKRQLPPPRHLKMEANQDWASVWPTAMTFKPSAVPLPVRMGYPVRKGVHPSKTGNTELMKIPNFLHLTPPAVKKHCAVLKAFCTKWPAALDSDEKIEKNFPLEFEMSDYLFSSSSLRHPKARIVKLRIKLSSLELDLHARRKLIKLVGDRYDPETDVLTIITDRCPVMKQNYDYAVYLLTVIYHESWKTEPWEADKSDEDMEEYIWDGSQSQKSLLELIQNMKHKPENLENVQIEEDIVKCDEVKVYKDAVTNLHNEDESQESIEQYKLAVKKLVHGKS